MTRSTGFRSKLCLVLAPLVWSVGYVAQSIGSEEIAANTYIGIGFLSGAAVLLIPMAGRRLRAARGAAASRGAGMRTLAGGALCGIALAGAQLLQQIALAHVAVGKAGFLTSLSIILVPVLSLALGRRAKPVTWIAAMIALTGLYIMFMKPGTGMAIGLWEWCLIGCAFLFAVQSILLGLFSPDADSLSLSFVQFVTAGLIGTAAAAVTGDLSLAGISPQAILSLVYFGVVSCGIGFTLQVAGQKAVEPSTASLFISLEAPFSMIAAFLLLNQRLTASELAGCAVMMAAILLSQLPDRAHRSSRGRTKRPSRQI